MQIRTSSSNSSVAPRYSTRRRMSVSGICVSIFPSSRVYRLLSTAEGNWMSRPFTSGRSPHHQHRAPLPASRGWFENVKKAPKKHNIGRRRTKQNGVGQISKRALCRRRPSSSSRLTSKKRSNVPRGRERKGHCMPAQIIYSVSATGWRIKWNKQTSTRVFFCSDILVHTKSGGKKQKEKIRPRTVASLLVLGVYFAVEMEMIFRHVINPAVSARPFPRRQVDRCSNGP